MLSPSQRSTCAVVVLIASVVASYWGFFSYLRSAREELLQQNVTAYLQRFEGLREALPRHARVGYLSNEPVGIDNATARIFLAQYALAPAIVDNSARHAVVVGNFRPPISDPRYYSRYGLAPRKDYGNGVVLLLREGR